MSIEAVRDLLVAAGEVSPATALTLIGERISPYVRAQDETSPCVTIEILDIDPFHNINTPPTLDLESVRVNCWAATYDEAVALSVACRDALEAAGLNLRGQTERYEPSVEEYLVAMDFTTFN